MSRPSTQIAILALLKAGPRRVSEFHNVMPALTRSALRTAISRLRDAGWEIICTHGDDPRYELILPAQDQL